MSRQRFFHSDTNDRRSEAMRAHYSALDQRDAAAETGIDEDAEATDFMVRVTRADVRDATRAANNR